MLESLWSKGKTHPLLVGVQTFTATMEISMAGSQLTGSQSTSRLSYTALADIPKNAQSYHEIIVQLYS